MLHVCHKGCDHTGVRCQKCGAEVGRDGVCQSCGWNGLQFTRPAATVHGTGNGEPKDWFESMPSLSDVPTPPASPTVTLDRETLETLLEIVPQFAPSTRYGKAFEDAISRLRAAEGKP